MVERQAQTQQLIDDTSLRGTQVKHATGDKGSVGSVFNVSHNGLLVWLLA